MEQASDGLNILRPLLPGTDPSSVVIVCFSGYQLFPLSERDSKKDISKLAQKISEAARFQLSESDRIILDAEYEAERLLEKLSLQGSIGMQVLRDQIAKRLSEYGIPSEHIFYRPWTEGSDAYDAPPILNEISRTIRMLKPKYVALIGHSYGACSAIRLSHQLQSPVDFMALVDTVFNPAVLSFFPFGISSRSQDSQVDNFPRAKRIKAWYQKGAEPFGFEPILNDRKEKVDNDFVPGVVHTTIDDSPFIHENIMACIFEDLTGKDIPRDLSIPISSSFKGETPWALTLPIRILITLIIFITILWSTLK